MAAGNLLCTAEYICPRSLKKEYTFKSPTQKKYNNKKKKLYLGLCINVLKK